MDKNDPLVLRGFQLSSIISCAFYIMHHHLVKERIRSDTMNSYIRILFVFLLSIGGVSPPPSPPTAASPAPTMAPGHGGSSPVSGLATLHHALHGLHNLHNLHNLQNFHNLQQNLQTQMAALAGLQGGLGVPGVGSLLHPPLAPQQHPGENFFDNDVEMRTLHKLQ